MFIFEGGNGKVFLAKEARGSKRFAVKVLEKQKLCKSQWSIDSIKRERNILIELKGHLWFTQLIFAKNTKDAIYLGLDYYGGGDLFNLQRKQRYFTEDVVRFYIAEILVAVNMLHSLGIIHRDLKCENILLTNAGHIVIGDFGLSRQLNDNQLAFSQIGTVGYVYVRT